MPLDPDDLGSIADIMTPEPVVALRITPLAELARKMVTERVHRVIIVDDRKRAVGVVTTLDLLDVFPGAEEH